jgi:alpha-tubulin suppressor-like RCC1 family protein
MAFTVFNSFLLTTDGRIFSWGGNTFCLGRTIHIAKQGETIGGMPVGGQQKQRTIKTMQTIDIGEIDFRGQVVISKLATGEAHVLALDTDK